MLAYVKYDDGYRAVLPDRLIKGFAPSDVDDFSKHRKVQAHWRSEDGATEGFYPATVHALAGSSRLLWSKNHGRKGRSPRTKRQGAKKLLRRKPCRKKFGGAQGE
ncbi:hypothetical protein MTO96_051128 [Rhipicephalus appendiculatus]